MALNHSQRKQIATYMAGGIIALAGVFILPWFVGADVPARGESYSLGFSNKTAVLTLYAAIGIVFVGLLLADDGQPQERLFESDAVLLPNWRSARWQYFFLLGASLICVIGTTAWNQYLVSPYWGESPYFLSRIDLTALGYRPYIDFQFNYGPLLIYLPVYISRYFSTGMALEDSYAISLSLGYVVGFLCLFVYIRTLRLTDFIRAWVLALTCSGWFVLYMGLQYIPLRHTILPCALALGHKSATRLASRRFGFLWVAATVVSACTACFLISPEAGIASAVAFFSYAVVLFRAGKWGFSLAFVSALGLSVLAAGTLSTGYLHSVIAFSSGAYNFPIFPNFHNLALVAASLFIIPRAVVFAWKQRSDPAAPLTAAMSAAGFVMLIAAFGRCDPGHVFFNGFLVFTMVLPTLRLGPEHHWARRGVLGFASLLLALGQWSYWSYYRDSYEIAAKQREFHLKNPEVILQWANDWNRLRAAAGAGQNLPKWRKVVEFPYELEPLLASGERIGTPLGIGVGVDRYLKLTKSFKPSYFPPPIPEVLTNGDVRRVLEECRANNGLILLPEGEYDRAKQPIDVKQYEATVSSNLSALMIYPVTAVMANPPFYAEIEIERQLLPGYMQVVREGGWIVARKR